MSRRKKFHFKRTDMWREGEWLDLWSVVHALSGVSMGFFIYLVHFEVVASMTIAFVLLVAYELWEAAVKIEETPANRIMDVVVGMVTFVPTYLWLVPALVGGAFWSVFAIIFAVNIIMAALGWIASRKAAVLERELRARYREERARAHARTKKLRKRLRR